MNLNSTTPKLEMLLHSHQVLTLNNPRHNMTIECKEGVVWVTAAGEYKDYVLVPGKRCEPKTSGEVVIEAINEACLDIEEQ